MQSPGNASPGFEPMARSLVSVSGSSTSLTLPVAPMYPFQINPTNPDTNQPPYNLSYQQEFRVPSAEFLSSPGEGSHDAGMWQAQMLSTYSTTQTRRPEFYSSDPLAGYTFGQDVRALIMQVFLRCFLISNIDIPLL
jgi:hypothetical protein